MDSFKEFKKIKNANCVCLIAHIDPDADALSSMVVMQDFLMDKFKIACVDMFAEGNVPDNCFEILDNKKLNLEPKQKYDAAIIMDCPNLDRVGRYKDLYEQANLKINIDHHATNELNNCISYFDVVSSSCEIVYNLLTYYNYNFSSSQLGKIYAALLTDTDGFSVGAITKDTYKIASACASVVKIEEIYTNFLKHKSLLNQQLYAKAINNIKEYKQGFIITYLTRENYKELKAKEEDDFGIANQLNTIYTSKLICFITPKGNNWYVSLRAKSGYDVSIIAKSFGGGGHKGAAAYISTNSLDSIIKDIEKAFKKQLKEIVVVKDKLFN